MDRKRKTGGRRRRLSCGALSGSPCTSTSKGRRIHSVEKARQEPRSPACVFVGQNANKHVYSGGLKLRATVPIF